MRYGYSSSLPCRLHGVAGQLYFLLLQKVSIELRSHACSVVEHRVVTFQVLTVQRMKITFWNIAPCSLVEVDRHFRSAYCLHHQGDEFLSFIFLSCTCNRWTVYFTTLFEAELLNAFE
jgi:hypothetical protein